MTSDSHDLRQRKPMMNNEESWSASSRSDEDQGHQLLDRHRPRGGGDPFHFGTSPYNKGKLADRLRLPSLNRQGGWLRSKYCFYISTLALTLLVTLAIILSIKPSDNTLDGSSPPWYPTPPGGTTSAWKESYDKASDLVQNMSLVEKVNITTGTGWGTNLCVGNTGSASITGFPMLCLQDGPLGIRFADNATLWPAGITAAATWNKDLIYKRGKGLGKEHQRKGVNVLLGPSMGPLGRQPAGGRNWEGFGSDPVLAGIAAAKTIQGIQDEGVMATAKHFIGNEQEHFRQVGGEWNVPNAISSIIDDRTLHELYLWPFQDSVKVGVASIMCSYNMINDSYACQNSKLMNGIIKDELGFQGFIQSDWLAQRSGVASALAGLDMSMPGDGPNWEDKNPFWGPNLTGAVLNGSMPIERLNDMATRIVAAWFQLKQDNETKWRKADPGEDTRPNFSSFSNKRIDLIHPTTDDSTTAIVNQFLDVQGDGELGDDDHPALAQTIAAEGHVLVKNEGGILPINKFGLSGGMQPQQGAKFRIGVFGEDAGPAKDTQFGKWPNQCEDRACNQGTLAVGWGSGAAEFPFLVTPLKALEGSFDEGSVTLESSLSNSPKDLPRGLSTMDLCFVFVNSDAGEGFHQPEGISDRKNLSVQKDGDKLVKSVASSCRRTIVVLHAVGPTVVEEWADNTNVKAIILANLPGEKSGLALTDVLFDSTGVDASGRLPYTVGRNIGDYGPGAQIMYKAQPPKHPREVFAEGLEIDYRYFDAHSIKPRYEFGFGLSYTTWSLSGLSLTTHVAKSPMPLKRPQPSVIAPSYPADQSKPSDCYFPEGFRRIGKYIYPYLFEGQNTTKADYPFPKGYNTPQEPSQAGGGEGGNPSLWVEHVGISVTLSNTGKRTGKQVVQLYVSFPNTTDGPDNNIKYPPRVLRAFEKLEVEAGKDSVVEMNLTRRDLSYWSVLQQNWLMPMTGQFNISVGFSSRDFPLSALW
ncbi:uncharacterized protein KY384_006453 [Bacidia gigantensis]|uniref:uncharacterized protein n=1 Tax=Bacidia gigantensis TaxID=2732470 RepID=UPI001D041F9D|nr:uncharacterized protein KY384_006453 [Bacidia gigantensis]KAG8528765.1 hypothetical protein KY384_006453 [Bacidia gigantensis]